jgi:hypothetical protein
MDGSHTVSEYPQLWWRRFRDFRLAETKKLWIFDNPRLCFGAHCAHVLLLDCWLYAPIVQTFARNAPCVCNANRGQAAGAQS